MASSILRKLLLLVFLFVVMQGTVAQSPLSNVQKQRVYRKSSGDSARLRPVAVKKAVKKAAGKTKKKTRSKVKAKVGSATDSVRFVQKQYSLGERVIMRGDSGKDVRKLAEILVNNLYIEESQIVYSKDGQVLYDGELVKAVMRVQEYNGFYPDGIVGKKLVRFLKKL